MGKRDYFYSPKLHLPEAFREGPSPFFAPFFTSSLPPFLSSWSRCPAGTQDVPTEQRDARFRDGGELVGPPSRS